MAKNVRLTQEEEALLKDIGVMIGEKTANKTIVHLINDYRRTQEELALYKDRAFKAEANLRDLKTSVNKRNHLDEYIRQQCN